MDAPNKQESKSWLDAAAVLTIGTAVVYAAGWMYWSTYFEYFGLSFALVGLSLEQVLLSTWWVAMLVLFVLLNNVIGVEVLNWSSLKTLELLVGNVAPFFGFLVLFGVLAFVHWPQWVKGAVTGVTFLISLAISLRYGRRSIEFDLKQRSNVFLVSSLVVAILFAASMGLGYNRAVQAARGENAVCVDVQTSSDPQPLLNLIWLARSSGMLFLATHPDREATAISESIVERIVTTPCVTPPTPELTESAPAVAPLPVPPALPAESVARRPPHE